MWLGALLLVCGGCSSKELPYDSQMKPSITAIGRKSLAIVPASPHISSVRHFIGQDNGHSLIVVGSGLAEGAAAEVRTPEGRLLGSVVLTGEKDKRTALLPFTISGSDEYIVKVANPDGRQSNAISFTLSQTETEVGHVSPDRCDSDITGASKTLYLGGGDAEKLFDRYLSLESDLASRVPYQLKIKFYQQDNSELTMKTVNLGEFEDLFLESRADFLEKMRKRLRGNVAVLNPALPANAVREKAHYLQCYAAQ